MVIANHVEIGGRILPEVDRISDVGQRRTALVVAADLDESTARRSVFRTLFGGLEPATTPRRFSGTYHVYVKEPVPETETAG